jgi:hypothetical protein
MEKMALLMGIRLEQSILVDNRSLMDKSCRPMGRLQLVLVHKFLLLGIVNSLLKWNLKCMLLNWLIQLRKLGLQVGILLALVTLMGNSSLLDNLHRQKYQLLVL